MQFQIFTRNPTPAETDNRVSVFGIIMQQDLTFTLHISDIVKRARDKFSWGLSVFKSRSEEVVLTLYKSLVRPILEYCCVLWNPMKIGEIAQIEGIQRTATSKIVSVSHINYWQRLEKLGLMSLQRRRDRYSLLYMFKILHNQLPNDVGIIFYVNPRLGVKVCVPPLPVHT